MDIDELIGAAVEQQPTRFAAAFDDLMGQKIAARLEDEKIAYAQQMFAEPEEDDEDYDDEDSFEDDVDFDIDDDEFDDEDFDLDDYDLDDLDIEEEDDDGEDA
jgi:hypothetical protein